MTDGELHAVSQAIGRLEAQVATLSVRMDVAANAVKSLAEDVRTERESRQELLNRGRGLLAGVAIAGGGVGALIGTKVKALLGM